MSTTGYSTFDYDLSFIMFRIFGLGGCLVSAYLPYYVQFHSGAFSVIQRYEYIIMYISGPYCVVEFVQ